MKKIRISSRDIIFEDENYIALNKHAGWIVKQEAGETQSNLYDSLKMFIKQRDKLAQTPSLFLFEVLPLDASGVIIFAKTHQGQNNLSKESSHSKLIKKEEGAHLLELSFYDSLSKKKIILIAKRNEMIERDGLKKYYIFNKPYNVLCQFTKQTDSELALCDYDLPKDIYPAGRLDKDSEGLLFLTNDGDLINKMSHPNYKKEKTYLVQVENIPSKESLKELTKGVVIKGGYKTLPCSVSIREGFSIEERVPPIRERKSIPTCWLEIKITEGKNRQVRSMTAAIGHPTLRLIRIAIDDIKLPEDLASGKFCELKK